MRMNVLYIGVERYFCCANNGRRNVFLWNERGVSKPNSAVWALWLTPFKVVLRHSKVFMAKNFCKIANCTLCTAEPSSLDLKINPRILFRIQCFYQFRKHIRSTPPNFDHFCPESSNPGPGCSKIPLSLKTDKTCKEPHRPFWYANQLVKILHVKMTFQPK